MNNLIVMNFSTSCKFNVLYFVNGYLYVGINSNVVSGFHVKVIVYLYRSVHIVRAMCRYVYVLN